MKKSLFSLIASVSVVAFSGASSAAPNQIDLTQVGTAHRVVLTQPKVGSIDNNMNVYERGSNHQAYATQNGETNKLRIHQNGSGNYAESHVTGNNNNVNFTQGQYGPVVSDVAITYDTTNSIATGNITGDGNAVTTTQRGNKHTSFNTVAGSTNTLTTNQIGSDAYFDSRVNGNGNIGTVSQNGNNIGGAITNGNSNSYTFNQIQRGGNNAGPNHAYLTQTGNSNKANVRQYTTASEVGLQITGNSNDLGVNQDSVRDDKAWITANGNGNLARVTQLNSYHRAGLTLNGSSNNVQVKQNGGYQLATINVKGNSNTFSSSQEGTAVNDLWADIQGNSNKGTMTQVGTGNVASLYQTGSDVAKVGQNGSTNQAFTYQLTANQTIANISQSGTGNTSVVNQ